MDQDEESETTVTKFNINGQDYYVKIVWEEDENDLFFVKILDNGKSWSGKFSTQNVEDCRSVLEEPEDVYQMNVKKAFSDDRDEFTYDFQVLPNDNRTARFRWKKKFEDATVMVHGFVTVRLDDVAESKDMLIDFLLDENRDLRDAIEVFNRRNEALTENLDRCKREMEEFVNMKTELENSLYAKFVQLLNEKKRRIRLLEENIQKF